MKAPLQSFMNPHGGAGGVLDLLESGSEEQSWG